MNPGAAIRTIAGAPRAAVETAIVAEVLEHDVWGVEVIAVLADGTDVSCRPAWLGLRGGRGDLTTFAVDEEVLVVFPGGARNAAVVLDLRPVNDGQGVGPGYDHEGDTRQLYGRRDVLHHLTGGVAPESVVVAPFLDDLSSLLGDFKSIGDAAAGITVLTALTDTVSVSAAVGTLPSSLITAVNTLRSQLVHLGTAADALKTLVDKSKTRTDGRAGHPHASDLLRAGNTQTR